MPHIRIEQGQELPHEFRHGDLERGKDAERFVFGGYPFIVIGRGFVLRYSIASSLALGIVVDLNGVVHQGDLAWRRLYGLLNDRLVSCTSLWIVTCEPPLPIIHPGNDVIHRSVRVSVGVVLSIRSASLRSTLGLFLRILMSCLPFFYQQQGVSQIG